MKWPSPTSWFRDTYGKFPAVYWTAMSFELMERGAYYLMMPILVIHAQYNLGVPLYMAAWITMFMYPLQYGIPILSGALAEKLGYRKQIIFAFSVLSIAYMFLSFANSTVTIILSVMLVGIGIGSYKPLVSATVAKSTSDKDRNFAYSIYYWIVNFAAAVFPTIWTIMEIAKIVDPTVYAYVFRVGSIFMVVNIFTAILIFKEVPRTGQVRTVKDVGRNISIAFRDGKFVVMVLLIGGFWALYSTMLNALPLTLFNFKLVPIWFTPMMLGIFNPATIILLGFKISKFVEKMESLKVVMSGIILYLVGLAIIGLTLNWVLVIVGIIIVSIGEFMVAPGYLAFVSKLAPKEKVSAYIGTNFLSSMVGLVGGTFVFGGLYTVVGAGMGRPRFFYGLLIAIGLLLLIGFMIYYKAWGREIIDRAKRIRMMEEGGSIEDYATTEPFIMRIFDRKRSVIVPMLLIPIILVSTFMLGTNEYFAPPSQTDDVIVVYEENLIQIGSNGYLQEGASEIIAVEVPGTPMWFNLSLSWEDEPAGGLFRENLADSFRIVLTSPDGIVYDGCNAESYTGSLTISFNTPPEDRPTLSGEWTVTVTCVEAGDIKSRGPFGLITFEEDNGNDWALTGSITTLVEA